MKLYLFTNRLFFTLIGIIKILLKSKFSPSIKKDKVEDGICYILGNGPSLLKDIENIPVDILSNQQLFVVNFFAQTDLYSKLRPIYYLLVDPAFFTNDIDKQLQSKICALYNAIQTRTTWKITIFVPETVFTYAKDLFGHNDMIKITTFNNITVKKTFKKFDLWLHDKQLATYGSQTVLNVATYLATYLGFKEINLLGVEHSWHKDYIINKDNSISMFDHHFYDENETIKLVPIPKAPGEKEPPKLHQLLNYSAIVFETYQLINDYAKYKGAKIYNRCSNSFIDAFERKEMPNLVNNNNNATTH